VSDIFREVEEDVRRERFEKLWKAYGAYAIAALMLLFAGIGGWQFWQHHESEARQKFSDSFLAAQRISNPQTAASTFADLAHSAPKGYSAVTRLSQAGAMFASGQRDGAIDLYKQIAKDDSGTIGSVARLRAAWAMSEAASRAELAELLKPLDQPGNAWRPNAREVLAYADYRAMDTKSALTKYNELALAPDSPQGLRARAKAMADFLKNGGATSYGTVPADAIAANPVAGPNPPATAATPAK
jgi:hypothetical protein